MATVNPVTDVTAAVAAIDTIITDAAAVASFNTDATGAPVVNSGNAHQVNACQALLKAAKAAQQLLNDGRYQSGSLLGHNITVS